MDKFAYCYFCSKKIAGRIARHFKDLHAAEREVTQMLLLTSKEEQKKASQMLKNKGNNKHNSDVISKREGEIIVARAPADESKFDYREYSPCDLCFGWYKEDELYRHLCPCAAPGVKPSLRAGQVMKKMMETNINEGMASVLAGMHDDDIGRAAKSDDLLLQWLELKVSGGFWNQKKWRAQTRCRMRLGGRLLVELRKKWPKANLAELLVVDKFHDCVDAVKACALSTGKEAAETPLKMGHLITSLIKRKHLLAITAKDEITIKEMVDLKKLWDGEWGERVTAHCHFALKERRRNEVPCIPTTDDTVTYANALKKKLTDALSDFEKSKTYSNYRHLQESALARICQYNRKRGGDVSEMLIADYERAKEMNVATTGEIFNSLTPEEKEAAQAHKLIILNGKKNKNNPCILDAPMAKALDLLVEFRDVASMHPENKFIFAIQSSQNSYLDPGKLRAKFVKEANVDPSNMVVRGMRKYVVTSQQVSFHRCI